MTERTEVRDFLYIDLQQLTPGKPFTGMAFTGDDLTDMLGRRFTFSPKELSDYVKNTLELIKRYKKRNMPGLPIDQSKHDKGLAAGWITGAEPTEVEDSDGKIIPAIRLLAEWTSAGVNLLAEKIMTNFSPTVDPNGRVITGGSLTNWPATVDSRGVPLFDAVELSQGVVGLRKNPMSEDVDDIESVDETAVETVDEIIEPESTGTEPAEIKPVIDPQPEPAGNGDETMPIELSALSDEQRAQLLEQAKKTVLADLTPGDNGTADEAVNRLREELNLSAFADVADLSKAREAMLTQMQTALKAEYSRMQANAGNMLAELMSQIKRDQHIAELSQKWTHGTDKAPHGFPVGTEEVEAFLGSLNDNQRKGAESIFGRIFEQGLVEFSELGHGRRMTGTAELGKPYAALLDSWIADGNAIAEFFEVNPELGEMESYNLSKYQEAK